MPRILWSNQRIIVDLRVKSYDVMHKGRGDLSILIPAGTWQDYAASYAGTFSTKSEAEKYWKSHKSPPLFYLTSHQISRFNSRLGNFHRILKGSSGAYHLFFGWKE